MGAKIGSLHTLFLSTPSARRATPRMCEVGNIKKISIHALREEGDRQGRQEAHRQPISIHALREEGDPSELDLTADDGLFLSTPSARRATFQHDPALAGIVISIHALREEGDCSSTKEVKPHEQISIHALREEGDILRAVRPGAQGHFYPRPPRGGRRLLWDYYNLQDLFLSTPSARRATALRVPIGASHKNFYPRPPRGGRLRPWRGPPSSRRFLSTPSARRATRKGRVLVCEERISIHALREEGDYIPKEGTKATAKFLSTPSARRATIWGSGNPTPHIFLSTPSARRATCRPGSGS